MLQYQRLSITLYCFHIWLCACWTAVVVILNGRTNYFRYDIAAISTHCFMGGVILSAADMSPYDWRCVSFGNQTLWFCCLALCSCRCCVVPLTSSKRTLSVSPQQWATHRSPLEIHLTNLLCCLFCRADLQAQQEHQLQLRCCVWHYDVHFLPPPCTLNALH